MISLVYIVRTEILLGGRSGEFYIHVLVTVVVMDQEQMCMSFIRS